VYCIRLILRHYNLLPTWLPLPLLVGVLLLPPGWYSLQVLPVLLLWGVPIPPTPLLLTVVLLRRQVKGVRTRRNRAPASRPPVLLPAWQVVLLCGWVLHPSHGVCCYCACRLLQLLGGACQTASRFVYRLLVFGAASDARVQVNTQGLGLQYTHMSLCMGVALNVTVNVDRAQALVTGSRLHRVAQGK
jgi:hypothetical protein